ncbi:MAG: hypothetical protein ACI4OJ_06225, partial [Lachnospiraceae bacterium]
MNNQNRFQEWIGQHGKLLMPLVLVVCCVLTAVIGLTAHRTNPHAAAQASDTESTEETASPLALQTDAYPAVNELFATYYQAMADGDTDTIESISSTLSDQEKIR